MDINHQLSLIMEGVKAEPFTNRPRGGQIAGMEVPGFHIWHPDIDVDIKIKECRSGSENKRIGLLLFELAVREIYKL